MTDSRLDKAKGHLVNCYITEENTQKLAQKDKNEVENVRGGFRNED